MPPPHSRRSSINRLNEMCGHLMFGRLLFRVNARRRRRSRRAQFCNTCHESLTLACRGLMTGLIIVLGWQSSNITHRL